MNITTHLVILKEFNKYEPNKPYVLFIIENGRVGDKFNVGPSLSGRAFPPEASERFETFEEAYKAYQKFLAYVEDKIKTIKPKTDTATKKPGGRPSYTLWK
jgi:hypothetical protein